jgi:hypothetical protein
MSLSTFIAKTGQDPNFIAWQAHMWFAFAVISVGGVWAIPVAFIAAALKEFWFDVTYEDKQTMTDGLLDFAGYASGIVLGGLSLLL